MNQTTPRPARAAPGAAAVLLALAGASAHAQTADTGTRPTDTAAAPSPYYLGASQGFTHDSNVYRIPSGAGDNYSSTSLLAGFDQRISRQRVFGTAGVSLNRYQDEKTLDNTSYDLAAGLVWETLYNLSGTVDATLDRHLSAPAATVGLPPATRNLAERKSVNGVARWGGVSLFTLEGTLGYSALDYSAPEYVSSESRQENGGLGLYYHPSAPLRLGVAVRFDRTRTPQAFLQPDGTYLPNQTQGRHLDLLASYELDDRLEVGGRLSYTRQTNSSAGSDADFSGVTGILRLAYRPTARLALNAVASRRPGFDSGRYGSGFLAGDTPPGTTPSPAATATSGLYENNRLTNSLDLGARFEATAKINVSAGLNWSRARIASTLTAGGVVGTAAVVDEFHTFTLGATYAIARPWLLGCDLSHDKRDVSGAVAYSYKATSIGCSARFTWR
ncbi:MAG: hypothetical protein ABI699_20255 [Caldimonas sp.]